MTLSNITWNLADAVAEDSRDQLASFWLSAPTDEVKFLFSSAFGNITVQLVRQLTNKTVFSADQVKLREELGDWFNTNGLGHPLAPQYMLANFLYSPPGLLTINNISTYFPDWLVAVYNDIYDVASKTVPSAGSATQFSPIDQHSSPTQHGPQTDAPKFGAFPNSLADLLNNRIHMNRILGLSNLFYIDPDDSEVTAELLSVRYQFAQCILSCPESDLERFWSTDLGDRYWSMVRSGIQEVPLPGDDSRLKTLVTRELTPSLGGSGIGVEGSTNKLLVAMLYYKPGTMKIADAESKLPNWLLQPYVDIFCAS